ncbi:MAG: methylenetetrahydrofolate--tRNA-(uracil(54)-C(5))-methyltransferase (FADH(2)-oxidizing) TrmFO, partial [Deltaproteobacteria bacterium]|nr:methylenetetrahydrofolate--tRNA-(uracil(54)-C(5))-methyltransferase (FADH(2)-oxidizing) TrmFO [Deltaproteobacteria bacterium]
GAGLKALIFEMKPVKFSPAHRNTDLAELVCSNSLRSASIESAVGLLKEEMRLLGSIVMSAADQTRIPAGEALAVDRERFSRLITERIAGSEKIKIIREEATNLPEGRQVIIAAGPLASDPLSGKIAELVGMESLYFYDAIAPVIDAGSIDYDKTFAASRYGKGEGDDYLNCPMTAGEYERFIDALLTAELAELHPFDKPRFFEGCMPIEEIARGGRDSPAYGPMKPVGLDAPERFGRPYAIVQLRAENREKSAYNIVGFQTRLKIYEQKRIFRMIPGLENAEFLRYGSSHRNTFINSPGLLNERLRLRSNPEIFFAGQITGVEGYVESAACGLYAGIAAVKTVRGEDFSPPSDETALGALLKHLRLKKGNFQPSNVNYSLIAPLEKPHRKSERKKLIAERALIKIREWQKQSHV